MTGWRETLDCRIASDARELEEVYRLRYACYRRDRSIVMRRDERFADEFDLLPNSFSFLVRSGKAAVATVRITVVSPANGWKDAPSLHVYQDCRQLESIAGESFVEASRLCFGPLARREAFVRLLGNMAAMADIHDARRLVACPREEHAGVYRRQFGFRQLGETRQYFEVKFRTELLAIRREELRKYVQNAKPMTEAWCDALLALAGSTHFQACATASAG